MIKQDFTYTWNATKQEYKVFKKGKYIITLFSFREVKNYIFGF